MAIGITAVSTAVLISVEYPADGISWARLYDNPILGWTVDETGATPPKPIIIGTLPLVPADTGEVLSPQWANYVDPAVFVPDLWRGSLADFFTWLATNNGVRRPLQARFGVSHTLYNDFRAWAQDNPDLSFVGDPPVDGSPPPPPESDAVRGAREAAVDSARDVTMREVMSRDHVGRDAAVRDARAPHQATLRNPPPEEPRDEPRGRSPSR